MTEELQRSSDARYLILMRHAKSDWGDESLSDHDRPLNRRGQRDAPNMARWLADSDLVPDTILISSSVRTRETVALMMDTWTMEPSGTTESPGTAEPQMSFTDELYHASPEEIIGVIQCDGGESRCLLVVAHNPGMTSLVSHFADRFTEMPTAAIAVFQADCEAWNDLQPGKMMLLMEHVRPKGLR